MIKIGINNTIVKLSLQSILFSSMASEKDADQVDGQSSAHVCNSNMYITTCGSSAVPELQEPNWLIHTGLTDRDPTNPENWDDMAPFTALM